MNVGENIVYFHTENNRLCTLAKTYLELLRSISPQLNLPEQTACICVECLDTIKQKYQQVILLVERYNGTFVLAAAKMAPAIITS